jgi:DNA-binding MarR family transcriptional regulator
LLHVQRTPSESAVNLSPAELGAWRGMLRVHAALVKELDAELEAQHGLPVTSYDVLVNLSEAPEGRLRMRDLAEAVLLSRSGLTRLVDRLAREGLLKRVPCPSDARGAFAEITAAGREKLAEARPTHLAGVRARFLDRLAPDELERLAMAWERVLPGAAARE